LFGVRFILAAPEGYAFDDEFVQMCRRVAPQGNLLVNGEPSHAVGQADIIYTDVWTSMGQEDQRDERRRRFAAFQVNEKLMAQAPAHARVMHCLPAVRGEEVSGGILDGDRSIVFQQAENRMHAQKALLTWLLRQK
jgi:ornithine carbamoyltransferase